MKLLLLEIDGLGSIADQQQRLVEANLSRNSYKQGEYLRHLYNLTLLAHDDPIAGSRSCIDYLAQQKWRIVLLTQRIRTREVYHATTAWLKEHGFDDFSYELVLKEHQYIGMPIAEWKTMKVWWYTQESIVHYKTIIFIDPNQYIREQVQQQWKNFSDQPLHTYSDLADFMTHQLLYEKERKLLFAEQRQALRRLMRGDAVQQGTNTSGETGELRAEPVHRNNLERGDVSSTSILPAAGEPTRSEMGPPSLSASDTGSVERVHEQERDTPELQEEALQQGMEACIVEEGERDGAEVQPPLIFEDVIHASCEDERGNGRVEMEIDDSEDEEDQQYEPVSPRKRFVKVHHMDTAYDAQDENIGKKRTKRLQRERQVIRSVKEAVLSYGSEEE